MANTVERLEELLDRKDRELEAVRESNEELERRLRYGVDWMLHGRQDANEDGLPVPRIELCIVDNSRYHVESQVVLVLRERDGSHCRVPLSYSKRSGAGLVLEAYPTKGELSGPLANNLPGVIVDACGYSEQTGLPLFVVLDEAHRYRATALRPRLTLQAV
jgi:hypothetical protein